MVRIHDICEREFNFLKKKSIINYPVQFLFRRKKNVFEVKKIEMKKERKKKTKKKEKTLDKLIDISQAKKIRS